jgi:hypothetical protein
MTLALIWCVAWVILSGVWVPLLFPDLIRVPVTAIDTPPWPVDPGLELHTLATRLSARFALLWYGLGALALLGLREATNRSGPLAALWARRVWSFAWLTYLAHVVIAFAEVHHWSHPEAVRHVERQSGFGPGIWFSHAFTLVWLADVAWWWVAPQRHDRRPAWVGWALHGYLAFITFNAAVVYAAGVARVMGVVLFVILGAGFLASTRIGMAGGKS